MKTITLPTSLETRAAFAESGLILDTAWLHATLHPKTPQETPTPKEYMSPDPGPKEGANFDRPDSGGESQPSL